MKLLNTVLALALYGVVLSDLAKREMDEIVNSDIGEIKAILFTCLAVHELALNVTQFCYVLTASE